MQVVRAVLFTGVVVLSGCSAQQGYAGGQAWQRSACERILDAGERARCEASAAKSYEEYERERREAGRR